MTVRGRGDLKVDEIQQGVAVPGCIESDAGRAAE
jgi:hypothetical protein